MCEPRTRLQELSANLKIREKARAVLENIEETPRDDMLVEESHPVEKRTEGEGKMRVVRLDKTKKTDKYPLVFACNARELLAHGSPTVSPTTRTAGDSEATRARCCCGSMPPISDSSSKTVGAVLCYPKNARNNLCTSQRKRRRRTRFHICQKAIWLETPASCRKNRHELLHRRIVLGNSPKQVQGANSQLPSSRK